MLRGAILIAIDGADLVFELLAVGGLGMVMAGGIAPSVELVHESYVVEPPKMVQVPEINGIDLLRSRG